MIYEKICAICGEKFQAIRITQKNCSAECMKIAKNARDKKRLAERKKLPKIPSEKICVICGKNFSTTCGTQKTCSDECFRELHLQSARGYRRKYNGYENLVGETIKCPECGKIFQRGSGHQKFCSAKCQLNHARKRRFGAEKFCQHCGKTFQPTKANQKFCSRECSLESQTEFYHVKKASRFCPVCGKGIDSDNPKIYCSEECAHTAEKKIAEKKIARSSPKKFKHVKQDKLSSHEKQCRQCGKIFKDYSGKKKFCSDKCADEYAIAHGGEKKICAACGKIFIGARRLTCSAECAKIYERFKISPVWHEARKRIEESRLDGRNVKFSDVQNLIDDLKQGTNNFRPRKISTLDETIRKAREAGMSYGKYIAMTQYGAVY